MKLMKANIRINALLTALACAACLGLTARAYDFMADGIAYDINPDGATVSVTYTAMPSDADPYANYTGASAVRVPSHVSHGRQDYAVTAIGENAFVQCMSLKQVTLPDGVATIGTNAFNGSVYLESVNIPATVITIGDGALTMTGIREIDIPNSVTRMGTAALAACRELSRVSLSEGLTEIPEALLMGCTKLKHITLPDHVTAIGGQAFYMSGIEEIGWPSSLQSIGSMAFNQCNGLRAVDLPDNVSWLGTSAFYQCGNLERVTLGNGLTQVGAGAFAECGKLKEAVFGPAVRRIEARAFMNAGLLHVNLPASVEYIGSEAFMSCKQLEDVHMGNGVTTIGSSAFSNCRSLCHVQLSQSLTAISVAMLSSTALAEIDIPSSVTVIEASAFTRCKFKELVIPNSVTSIGSEAFGYCSELTRAVVPNSVTDLSTFVFAECMALEEISLGDGVKRVDYGLMNGCNAVKTMTLGAGIESIKASSNWPLGSCQRLTRLYNRRSKPIGIDENLLQQVDYNTCVLYVPAGSAAAYRNAPVWQRFIHIKEFDPDSPVTAVKGDVNLDGEANIADVNTLVDLILSQPPFAADADTDVNHDGEVNIADINYLIDIILTASMPPCGDGGESDVCEKIAGNATCV